MGKIQQTRGKGDTPFDDRDLGTLGKIDKIVVRHGDWINGIQFFYRGLDSNIETYHGDKEGGKSSTFGLDEDEFVTKIEVRSGNNNAQPADSDSSNQWIFALRFTTSKMIDGAPHQSPWYGLHPAFSDWSFVQQEHIVWEFEDGDFLTGIYGSTKWDQLTSLGVYYDEDPVVSVELQDLVLVPTSVAPANQAPDVVARIVAINESSEKQTGKKSVSATVSNTHKFTKSLGFKEGTGFKISGDYKAIKLEWSVSFEASQTYQWGEDTTVSRTDAVELDVTVPPKRQMTALLWNQKGTFNASYSATQISTHRSGAVISKPITGQFEGLIASQTSYRWLPDEPVDGKPLTGETWSLTPE